jgi:D-alanyl-lipoteichoic acid acyltransferase DltB (MBOAT superfamily)
MTLCRYLPEGITAEIPQKASVRVRPSVFSDSASLDWEILRIFYALDEGEVSLTVSSAKQIIHSGSLPSGTGIQAVDCEVKGAKDLLIEFEGRVSPDIYGLSIESRKGVIVDNIPQRGSAGLEFTMVDRENLKEAFRLLSPDLLVLHYGLNIVKNVSDDYSFYKRGLIRQMKLVKEISPSAQVLLIGVTDMARREGDSIRSYNNIPAIVEAQKEAAMEAGVAFWDSYAAMGGEMSIVEWAGSSPPLAQGDFVHFTYPGADTLSVLLNKALFLTMNEDTSAASIPPEEKDIIAAADSLVTSTPLPASASSGKELSKSFFSFLRYDPDKPFIFTLPGFWLFLLVVLAGYGLVYRRLHVRNFYLLVVSLFFYFKTGGLFLFILVFITIVDYICGLLIFSSERKNRRRFFLLLSIISNLLILAWFKYTGFIVETLNDLAGTDLVVYDYLASLSNIHLGTGFDITNIILPAGISFFTFQSLSYTFDIYRRKLEPVRNIFDFGFYVSFFPQLVAGPIVRASEFVPQLYAEYDVTKREFSHALFMIMKGLIKKIVISDFIAVNFVDGVFNMPALYSGLENLLAVYGYGLQIYCDFSGYTDIAIGVALILGFRLPVNFNSPYKASGIADFWRRWHISLSRWLKDYLYISLGGNRKGRFRTGLNLMITMLLGGLWHGAALRFVLWGGLHGLGLIINKIWDSLTGGRFGYSRAGRITGIFITFNFVSFCWIFFRAHDMDSALMMLRQIAENFQPGSYLKLVQAYSSVLLLMVSGYLIHFLPEKIKESYRGLFIRMPFILQMAVIMLAAVLIIEMKTVEAMPFIYFRF